MGSLLTSFSSQFAKVVVLGTMFPVLIVSGLNLIFVASLFPFGADLQDQVKRIAFGEASWPVAALTFTVLVITGVLYNLNIPIIRLYEGYPWRDSAIGRWRVERWQRQLAMAKEMRVTLGVLRNRLRAVSREPNLLDALSFQRMRLKRIMNSELPDLPDLVLPTRLGNVIRCFEQYPYLAYGIDSIVVWPRLIAKIDAPFAATIDEAKTSFDFMLNCSLLTALTGFTITSVWLSRPGPLVDLESIPWAWRAALFFSLAALFYEASIGAAASWGTQVRAAFDLYRLELLKALGYQRPLTRHEERAMWKELKRRMLYGESIGRMLDHREVSAHVTSATLNAPLTLSKRHQASSANMVAVTIRVGNKGSEPAEDVRVIDTIPEGYKCLVETVKSPHGTVEVIEVKPLELALGEIAPKGKAIVHYTIRSTAV